MRKIRRRFRLTRPVPTTRRYDDGREVCLANEAGRAEYQRRKQLLWAEQDGHCALPSCGLRMSLLEARMTHGNWQAIGQLRDDRLGLDKNEKPINQLVHKGCMAKWFELAQGTDGTRLGTDAKAEAVDAAAACCFHPLAASLGT